MTRALQLVSQIYQAIVEPDAWNDFLEQLSEALGGASLQLALHLPGQLPSTDSVYHLGLDERYRAVFLKHAVEGLPWEHAGASFRGRFEPASQLLAETDVRKRPFYLEFMQPQGLAPEWPLCHVIAAQGPIPLAGLIAYRREGARAFEAEDLALLDSLVPHLSRAYDIRGQLAGVRQQRSALTEVVDRLPLGVILIDADGQVVLSNRSADEMLGRRDGILLERGRLCLSDAKQNAALQELVRGAIRQGLVAGSGASEVLAVMRPSGQRALTLRVGPLLDVEPGSEIDGARAAIFVADPEREHIRTTSALESLYRLTRAEAELVRMMAEGQSLEQISTARGVTINTVRSQLKQVFSKTDTNRQGELVHLVLAGVASIRPVADGEA